MGHMRKEKEEEKMTIKFTKHAVDMLREWNIDRNLVESAVENPDIITRG